MDSVVNDNALFEYYPNPLQSNPWYKKIQFEFSQDLKLFHGSNYI
jgi:hypothetical protein